MELGPQRPLFEDFLGPRGEAPEGPPPGMNPNAQEFRPRRPPHPLKPAGPAPLHLFPGRPIPPMLPPTHAPPPPRRPPQRPARVGPSIYDLSDDELRRELAAARRRGDAAIAEVAQGILDSRRPRAAPRDLDREERDIREDLRVAIERFRKDPSPANRREVNDIQHGLDLWLRVNRGRR